MRIKKVNIDLSHNRGMRMAPTSISIVQSRPDLQWLLRTCRATSRPIGTLAIRRIHQIALTAFAMRIMPRHSTLKTTTTIQFLNRKRCHCLRVEKCKPRLSHDGYDGDGLGGCRGCWWWSGGGSSVACDDEVEEMKMKVVVMMMTRGCWWCDGVDRDDGDSVDMVTGERRRRGRGGSGDRRL
ncbi:hypothetical protein Tco_1012647 [Tanacetum coccineum]